MAVRARVNAWTARRLPPPGPDTRQRALRTMELSSLSIADRLNASLPVIRPFGQAFPPVKNNFPPAVHEMRLNTVYIGILKNL